mgnify:CR=1 FL=1
MSTSGIVVGADIGGTFTDVVVADRRTGRSVNVKVLTTPDDPAAAVIAAAATSSAVSKPWSSSRVRSRAWASSNASRVRSLRS